MKFRQVTQRIGEDMGPIDWSHEMVSEVAGRCSSIIEALKYAEQDPSDYQASTYGGWPRIWHDILRVRMYDGWPYWRPTPSVLLTGTLGPEWHSFVALTAVKEKTRCTP